MMNDGPEWRAFSQDERESRSRVGMPLSFSVHDKGLSTMIGQVGKDAFGRTIPSKTMFQMLRLKKWHIRSSYQSSVDRNLSHAMTELSRLCDKLHIPKQVKERAAVIYRKALEKGLVRGRSISAQSQPQASTPRAAQPALLGHYANSPRSQPSTRRTSPAATDYSSGS